MPRKAMPEIEVPSPHNWRTTDEDEINRRKLRARTEAFEIANTDSRHPIFSNFRIRSRSGMTYSVEIRSVAQRQFSCDCVDFRINGLGTCKHVEAVLLHLEGRFKRLFASAVKDGSARLDVMPDPSADTVRLAGPGKVPTRLSEWFDADGLARGEDPVVVCEKLRKLATGLPQLRLSQELASWLEMRGRAEERKRLRRVYEQKVQSGEWPAQETKVPLFPYQREGMLHLAFTERALLADEMGLGKTVQAIAACALLHRLGQVQRVLVVTPASLKTEWEEQIQRFTDLPYQLVFGGRLTRLRAYASPPFFTIVNYEQMLADALDVNQRLRPDVVVLDEAQRIKNWSAKTTQAIKRLVSRYAFVLSGTPIENRIDELFSLMAFLNPALLGPLFRFNREYHVLDDRGRPIGYQNLERLHQRIKPYLLRRRKAEVETELPERTDRNHFVQLSQEQKVEYEDHYAVVLRLASIAHRRPLTQQEQERLLRHLGMMRMVCDTNYILNPESRACPKLAELEKVLEECRDNPETKVIVFSEWQRMLELVRCLCQRLDIGFAWHTGSVSQRRRRGEINAFKSDPDCRVFLSTDSGASGLNLQVASVVINCDLPWNPAKLEQRIARAWRKHQSRPVTVINLVSENTIEHRMLETLSMKQALADGLLDRRGDLGQIRMTSGRQSFMARLQQLVTPASVATAAPKPPAKPVLPADRPRGFAAAARERINGALRRCEERYPALGDHSVIYVVVERDAARWSQQLAALHQEYFGDNPETATSVRLEVVDEAFDQALQRMIDAGLVARTTRAARPLLPQETGPHEPAALTSEELATIRSMNDAAAKKLKMATVLGGAGFLEEARSAVQDAILPLGQALAALHRYPIPGATEDLLLPPMPACWGDAFAALKELRADPAVSHQPALEHLMKVSVSLRDAVAAGRGA